jgi:hypothetical protein
LNRLWRIEFRHAWRNGLMWAGALLALAATVRSQATSWPFLLGDQAIAYSRSWLLVLFALLAASWIALRDHRSGTSEAVAATNGGVFSVAIARLLALAASSLLFSIAYEALALGLSAARGGRGSFSGLLLLDLFLRLFMGASAGYAVAWLSRSSLASLLAAATFGLLPLLPVWLSLINKWRWSVEWLIPSRNPDMSAQLGFLPNVFNAHATFVGSLAVLLVAILLVFKRDLARPRRRTQGLLVAGLASFTVGALAAVALLRFPDSLAPNGPDPSRWEPVYNSLNGLSEERPFVFPDTGDATTCDMREWFTACVFPAYGAKLASRIASQLEPEAQLLRGLPGVAHQLRMVPASGLGCRGSSQAEVVLQEPHGPSLSDVTGVELQGYLIRCAFIDYDGVFSIDNRTDVPRGSQNAVALWVFLEIGRVTANQAIDSLRGPPPPQCPPGVTCGPFFGSVLAIPNWGWTPEEVAAALRMAAEPAAMVREQLTAIWPRILNGEADLSELPGSG